MNGLTVLFNQLFDEDFWGTLTITFKKGRPVLIRKEEQIKIEECKTEVSRRSHRFHTNGECGNGRSTKVR